MGILWAHTGAIYRVYSVKVGKGLTHNFTFLNHKINVLIYINIHHEQEIIITVYSACSFTLTPFPSIMNPLISYGHRSPPGCCHTLLPLQDLHLVAHPHSPPGLKGDHQLTKHGVGGAAGSSVLPQNVQRPQLVWLSRVLVNACHLATLHRETLTLRVRLSQTL